MVPQYFQTCKRQLERRVLGFPTLGRRAHLLGELRSDKASCCLPLLQFPSLANKDRRQTALAERQRDSMERTPWKAGRGVTDVFRQHICQRLISFMGGRVLKRNLIS